MSTVEHIKQLLASCSLEEKAEVLAHLREDITIHPLEVDLNARAEVILEAIRRAGGLTLRMIRGVIADAAFGVEVVDKLPGWHTEPKTGDLAYDFLLRDAVGPVRVQVKLQRSKGGKPMTAQQADRTWSPSLHVAETQKTRGGTTRGAGKQPQKTRPYRFGEFDVLAVSTQPVTGEWNTFVYTVADWLVPGPSDPNEIHKFQPVATTPNSDWTDDFVTVVTWYRAGQKKTIRTT